MTFSVFMPRSTCVRLTRLFRNSPVGISNTAEMVTCAQTSSLRTPAVARVQEDCPDSSLRVVASDTRDPFQAGYNPNNRPVTTERPRANSSTGQIGRAHV